MNRFFKLHIKVKKATCNCLMRLHKVILAEIAWTESKGTAVSHSGFKTKQQLTHSDSWVENTSSVWSRLTSPSSSSSPDNLAKLLWKTLPSGEHRRGRSPGFESGQKYKKSRSWIPSWDSHQPAAHWWMDESPAQPLPLIRLCLLSSPLSSGLNPLSLRHSSLSPSLSPPPLSRSWA